MGSNIFLFLSLLVFCSISIVPFLVGMIGISFGKRLFGKTLLCCLFLSLTLLIVGLAYDCAKPVFLNDVSLNIHYIDGYSEVISEHGIRDFELPCMIRTHSGTMLKCANKYYYGVIRYDYVSKKRYMVEK